jgi:hypothetical protein
VLCQQRDLCAGARVASDGSTCKAVNAKERHCTAAKLTTLLPQLDPRVAGSRKALAGQENEAEAGTPGGAVADHVQATLAALPPRQRLSGGVQAQ